MPTMAQSGSIADPERTRNSFIARSLALGFGVLSYLVFFVTFLYAIGFVSQLVVPKTIDSGPASSPVQALIVDLVLLSLFAIQHSGMARQGFKRLFASFASRAIERSTYVILASR